MKFTDVVNALWDTSGWEFKDRFGFETVQKNGVFFYRDFTGITFRDVQHGETIYDPNPLAYVFIISPLASRVVRHLNKKHEPNLT